MGQLEKYGLYVLVLLAFLIIGVAIWGEPAKAGGGTPNNALSAPATSPKVPAHGGGTAPSGGNQAENGNAGASGNDTGAAPKKRDLAKELQQAPPIEPKKGDAGNNAGGDNAASKKANGGDEPTKVPPTAEEQRRPDYKVKTGETFERIAREQLGHAGMSGEIAKLNSKIEPTKLKAGQVIVLPSKAEVAAWKAARAPKKGDAAGKGADSKTEKPQPAVAADKSTYTVARGDTFEGIARRVLGDPKRARDIQQLNPDVTPTSMKIGTVLKMPAK